MPALEYLAGRLAAGNDLTPAEAAEAAGELASPHVGDEPKALFLSALAGKGETASEVASFARVFLERSVDPGLQAWAPDAIDVVGTGGDHAGSFNISSLTVLVLACAGVPVMKHGNRGITSRCGSADLMAAFGVALDAPPEKQRRAMAELGFTYLFAPAHHPAFRAIGPVRKALAAKGQRSIFNILGPLINPGRPAHILLGSFSEAWVPRLAEALDTLGSRAGVVGHGVIGSGKGVDELTTATANKVRGAGRLRDLAAVWRAADFGLKQADFSELLGGDLEANLALTEAILSGRAPEGLADTIALNASIALWICGRTAAPETGVAQARELLLGGAVRRKMAATKEFFRS